MICAHPTHTQPRASKRGVKKQNKTKVPDSVSRFARMAFGTHMIFGDTDAWRYVMGAKLRYYQAKRKGMGWRAAHPAVA